MMVWTMRYSSFEYLYRYAVDKGIDKRWKRDVASLIGHYALWVAIPLAIFGWNALALYVVLWLFISLFLAAVFTPAHIGLPILSSHEDTWRLQFETTRNLMMPRWLSTFFIGLDYQVEHHLFPKISHMNLKKTAEITRDWAARNGVPYQEIHYWRGLCDSTSFIRDGWKYEPMPDAGPLAAPGSSDTQSGTLPLKTQHA
jgi:fatty acid desaturase